MGNKVEKYDTRKISRIVSVEKNANGVKGTITGGNCGWCDLQRVFCDESRIQRAAKKALKESLEHPERLNWGKNVITTITGMCSIPPRK